MVKPSPKHAAGISCSASKKENPTRCSVFFLALQKNLLENIVFCENNAGYALIMCSLSVNFTTVFFGVDEVPFVVD